MKVILFGATGMVGQGVLRECLVDPAIENVLAIVRSPTGQASPKLEEMVQADVSNLSAIEGRLGGLDACFFCLGVSSAGMSEDAYRKVTYELTLQVARTLLEKNPNLTFVYVSGAGTESSERGRSMWARVKGQTENALLQLPFKAAYMFRPGFIQPLHGIRSKTAVYRVLYAVVRPVAPLIRSLFPKAALTTEQVGRAMICVARQGAPKRILESADIAALA